MREYILFSWEGVFCGVLLRDEGVEFFGCRNGSFDEATAE
jgi:hypothetical protein